MAIDEFEHGDPFSPETIALAQSDDIVATEDQNKEVERYLMERRSAYAELFTAGPTTQWAVDFVMNDLAEFCRAHRPTWDLNPKVQDLQEGRRETYNRIVDYSRLSRDQLLQKYTSAKYK